MKSTTQATARVLNPVLRGNQSLASCARLLSVGGGDEGVLEGAILHGALEVVVHAAGL